MHRVYHAGAINCSLAFYSTKIDSIIRAITILPKIRQSNIGGGHQREIESASEKERERDTYINFGKNLAATRIERGNKRETRREPVCNIFHGWMETTMVSL